MVGRNFLPSVIASAMWSAWPCVMVITSIASKRVRSRGQAGLLSTHGSSSSVFPERVFSLKELWPSHVSSKPRFSTTSAPDGARRDLILLLESRGEVPQHRRLVDDTQPLEAATLAMELDHRIRHIAHLLAGVDAARHREAHQVELGKYAL